MGSVHRRVAVSRALKNREVYDSLSIWEEMKFVRHYRDRKDALITAEEKNGYTESLSRAGVSVAPWPKIRRLDRNGD
jgi:hypothetical protein